VTFVSKEDARVHWRVTGKMQRALSTLFLDCAVTFGEARRVRAGDSTCSIYRTEEAGKITLKFHLDLIF